MSDYKDVYIHESSYVDSDVEIGEGTKIWFFSHILNNTKIGKKCSLGQNVSVGPNVEIGSNVKIQNNVSVYEGVTLKDNVFCGPSCVFTNVINPRSSVERKDEFKKTIVFEGASIGANSTIICGNNIGEYALIAAGSVVTKEVKPYSVVMGSPAKQTGWITKFGTKIDLPLKGSGTFTCSNSGEIYTLKGDSLEVSR